MLQLRTIEPRTLGLLRKLNEEPLLANNFLVGGTALSLQLGHRFSLDLDLFSHKAFDVDILLEMFNQRFNVQPLTVTNKIFICIVDDVKVDIVHFRYPFAFPVQTIDGVRLADIRDIASMKLDAIVKRGSKKDFYDIYYLFQKFSLEEILEWYKNMFGHSVSFHVIRSLTYFVDAELSEMPIVFDKKLTWDKVKKAIIKEIQKL